MRHGHTMAPKSGQDDFDRPLGKGEQFVQKVQEGLSGIIKKALIRFIALPRQEPEGL